MLSIFSSSIFTSSENIVNLNDAITLSAGNEAPSLHELQGRLNLSGRLNMSGRLNLSWMGICYNQVLHMSGASSLVFTMQHLEL